MVAEAAVAVAPVAAATVAVAIAGVVIAAIVATAHAIPVALVAIAVIMLVRHAHLTLRRTGQISARHSRAKIRSDGGLTGFPPHREFSGAPTSAGRLGALSTA